MATQKLKTRVSHEVSDLNSLAKQIDAAHVEVQAAVQAGVKRAIEAGQLLIQAKEQVPHGQWETWVSENTTVSPRSASAYMRIARHWTEADDANRQRAADLSLRAWLEELAGPSFKLASHRAESDDVVSIVGSRAAQSEEKPKTFTVVAKQVEVESETNTALAATMKNIREAEEKSAARHVITGDSIQSGANLDGINREWNKLNTTGRDKFLSEKLRTHGHPDHRDMDIIDVTA